MTTDEVGRPKVSVAVSTYRRKHLLPRLIAALESQTLDLKFFEVVVVDDGSQDGTATVLQELVTTSKLALTVITADHNVGPAAGRNLAWRAARADLVAFTDDDCCPTPGWLEAALRAVGPATFVVGRTDPAPEQFDRVGAFSRTVRVSDTRFMQTCNVLYPRVILEELGGFDERFRTGEDTDLGLRALENGYRAVFADDAVVYHDIRPSALLKTLRESQTWVDLPLVVRRHPQVRKTHLYGSVFWKPSHPRILALAFGVVATAGNPLALLLVSPWLWWRLVSEPLVPAYQERLTTLPGALLVDATEVLTMMRGSIRHGVFVL